VHGTSGRQGYRFEPPATEVAIRLEIGAFRPFIPGVDENDPITVLLILMQNGAAQPTPKIGWRRAVEDLGSRFCPRCIIPAHHYRSVASSLDRMIQLF
jgi:hypothetical protein